MNRTCSGPCAARVAASSAWSRHCGSTPSRSRSTTRIEAHWPDVALEDLVAAWQAWAPDAPDELTVNLTLVSEPGAPVRATLFGACNPRGGTDPGAAAGVHRSGGRPPRSSCAPACPTTA